MKQEKELILIEPLRNVRDDMLRLLKEVMEDELALYRTRSDVHKRRAEAVELAIYYIETNTNTWWG